MKKVWLWIIPVVGLVALLAYSEATRPAWEAKQKAEKAEALRVAEVAAKAEADRKGVFVAKVLARIPTITKLATVTFNTVIEGKEVTSRVEFPSPVSSDLARGAARMTTQAVIDTLMSEGQDPGMTFIFTSAYARTTGVSGRQLLRAYGNAIYHPVNDRIVFTPD